jgi:hypothetical protein
VTRVSRLVVAAIVALAGGCGGPGTSPAANVAPTTATAQNVAPATGNAAPMPSADVTKAEPAAAAPANASSDVVQAPPPAEHEAVSPSAACLARRGEGLAARPAGTIHRWVDAGGITHYADTAPTTAVSAHRVIEVKGLPPVRIEANGDDVNLPADVQQRAIADSLAVQRVFHDALGVDSPAVTALRIVFVADAARYGKLIGDPTLAASTGAYAPQQHTIVVRVQGNDELAFAVLRHEITHALIHEDVGNLPVALNEGLAEYFRRYRIAGLGGEIDIGADRAALIASAPSGDGTDALVELLALSGADFYAADRDRRYVQAYALVALLMADRARTAALHDVLARQREAPCVAVAAENALDARYPGGLAALAADWAAFMRDPPPAVRTY